MVSLHLFLVTDSSLCVTHLVVGVISYLSRENGATAMRASLSLSVTMVARPVGVRPIIAVLPSIQEKKVEKRKSAPKPKVTIMDVKAKEGGGKAEDRREML